MFDINNDKIKGKNIFWLASYPKSGNTMLRLFLSLYFFTEDGILNDFSVKKNINTLNNYNIYKKIRDIPPLDSFVANPETISNYWLRAQKKITELYPKKIFFFKTHNAQIKFNSFDFTNSFFTRGFVYIVRDPRCVLLSTIDHYGHKTFEDATKYLLSDKHITYVKGNLMPEFILSWKSHFLSWRNFLNKNKNLGLIIKYEDMVKNPKEIFLKILNFLQTKINFEINLKKFTNAVDAVEFKKLQKLEKKITFDEKSNSAKSFFRKGIVDDWESELPIGVAKLIERNFDEEMRNLHYL